MTTPWAREVRNGLRVVALAAPGSEVVGAALAVGVGSRSERRAWSGLAHLAEHVACGAATEAAAALTAAGGTCNAVTQPDFTVYYGDVVAERGDLLLDRLLEVLATGGGTKERIRAETAIVADEISAAVDGAVMGGFPWLWLPAALYDEPEFAHNGYGDLRSLARVTPDVLASFFARYYTADNTVLAMSAPDPEPLLAHLAAARPPRGPAPAPRAAQRPIVTTARATRLHAPEQPHQATAVSWSLPCPPLSAAHVDATVLADVLVGPVDGVLDDAAQGALEVAAYVGPFADPWDVAEPLPFVVEVHHEPEQNPAEMTSLVLDVLRGAEWDGELVAAAAGRLTTSLLERLADPIELPRLAAAAEFVHGGVERLAAATDALVAVEPAGVREAAGNLAGAPYRVLTRGPRQ